ncbi:MAG: coproporphyrinogen III oxidase family protein, partial [Candidatus Omnitrophica bacterium]|nr:coproporphyrinogen III oxidase family protein [Candidatus Omnitrophota bacterium]
LDEARLRVMRVAGVNRVSLGIQSLDDRYLAYLGRNHDADKARQAYRMVRGAGSAPQNPAGKGAADLSPRGFTNVNVDLMFSFPGQTLEEIKADVAGLTALGSEHISLYMLNLEEHSRFYARKVRLPDDDLQAGQYGMVAAELERAGYGQYEISNFARPGKESRHNLNYWQGGEYIGLGVGAHSYLDGKLSWNVDRLNIYIDRVGRGEPAVAGFRQLDGRERFKQALLIGLRMNRGVEVEGLQRLLDSCLTAEEQGKIEQFIRHGFFVREDGYLKATDKGRLVLDELCSQLI